MGTKESSVSTPQATCLSEVGKNALRGKGSSQGGGLGTSLARPVASGDKSRQSNLQVADKLATFLFNYVSYLSKQYTDTFFLTHS